MQNALFGVALATATALSSGLARADPTSEAADGAKQLVAAIGAHDAGAVAKGLTADLFVDADLGFDATCEKQFPTSTGAVAIGSKDTAAFATCLSHVKLQPATRKSALSNRAVLVVEPGFELELVFVGTKVRGIYQTSQGRARDGEPTLTSQAFEALRKAGSKNVDAAVRATLDPHVTSAAGPVYAWIKVCLDSTGAVTSTKTRQSTNDQVSERFIAAIQNWKFQPFKRRGVATAVCSFSLLTYPAAKAPVVETLPLPSPPPPSVIVPKKIKVKDLVQPVRIEKRDDDEDGEEGGVEGGVMGGEVGGVVGGPPPPPPPPPADRPQIVAPAMLEGSRISGEKQIAPDDITKVEIMRAGKEKLVGSYKLCVAVTGTVVSVSQLKSTGFPAYDAKIQRSMRLWQYKPYMVNGKAVPVCTAVTFIYSQPLPPPKP